MTRRIFRYVVPADGREHAMELHGPLSCAMCWASRSPGKEGPPEDEVEFWAEYDSTSPATLARFRVFGTGDPLPEHAVHFGSAPRTPEGMVWHLYIMLGC